MIPLACSIEHTSVVLLRLDQVLIAKPCQDSPKIIQRVIERYRNTSLRDHRGLTGVINFVVEYSCSTALLSSGIVRLAQERCDLE